MDSTPQTKGKTMIDPLVPAPQCKVCHCTTGGGEFCYEHAPYMVYPQADGSFLVDRNGRKHVWLEEPPSLKAELHDTHDALTQASAVYAEDTAALRADLQTLREAIIPGKPDWSLRDVAALAVAHLSLIHI